MKSMFDTNNIQGGYKQYPRWIQTISKVDTNNIQGGHKQYPRWIQAISRVFEIIPLNKML